MKKSEALTVVIDVATKRRPHSRKELQTAVSVLEPVKVRVPASREGEAK